MKIIEKTLTAMLALTLAGCGSSHHESAKAEAAICTAIMDTNLARQCKVENSTAAIVIESDDDEAAREACAKIAAGISRVSAKLSGSWQLEIFSPYRTDKQIASCELHP
jgi:hypothetical protein